jgi:hypothetical protein
MDWWRSRVHGELSTWCRLSCGGASLAQGMSGAMVLRNSSTRAREEEGDEGLIGARAAAVMRRGYDEDRW